MKHAFTLLAFAANTVAAGAWAQTSPDMSVQFTGPVELQLGRADHYKLSVTNLGSAVAPTTSSTMTFPPGVELDTKINTATGKAVPKVPTNCSYSVTPAKRLTCLANNVAVGETRNFTIDLRAPLTSAVVGTFTWTTTAAGDLNSSNDTASHDTLFGSFSPNTNLNFPATLTYWVAMGRKNVLDNPMTRPSGVMAVDANGDGVGSMGVPVTWKATKVGTGLSVQIHSSMYSPAVDMNLTPFNSHCYQGMGYWTGLQDSYEVRMCY